MAAILLSLVSSLLKAVLEMDHIGTKRKGNQTIYTFKTTSAIESFVEMKSKILSVLDFPIDVPENIVIKEVKRGPVFREYVVDITVDNKMIGQLGNLLAKKYGVVRTRKYKKSRRSR